MSIQLSESLIAFIEKEYFNFLKKQELEAPLREAHRLDKDAKRKTIERNRETNLKKIESLHLDGILEEKNFQDGKVKVLNKEKKEKEQLAKENKESLKHLLEGKSLDHFDIFVLSCWHLIRKEKFSSNNQNIKKLSDIENWIVEFLRSQQYIKQDQRDRDDPYYNIKDIKRIINKFKKDSYLKNILSLIEHIYQKPIVKHL